jgi:hypothetical protein
MPDDPLEERLAAVERAVRDGDGTAAVADESLRDRVAAVEDDVADLEAAVQAVRGYVGGVRHVNDEVEQRADAAMAKAQAVERAVVDGSTHRDARVSTASVDTGPSSVDETGPTEAGDTDPSSVDETGPTEAGDTDQIGAGDAPATSTRGSPDGGTELTAEPATGCCPRCGRGEEGPHRGSGDSDPERESGRDPGGRASRQASGDGRPGGTRDAGLHASDGGDRRVGEQRVGERRVDEATGTAEQASSDPPDEEDGWLLGRIGEVL